jgi:hypothetical protein
VFDLRFWFSSTFHDFERPQLHVGLDARVGELSADKAFSVEDSVGGVHGDLILCRVSNEPLRVSEPDVGGGRPITLIVGDDFDFAMLEDADARISCSQIDSDCRTFRHFVFCFVFKFVLFVLYALYIKWNLFSSSSILCFVFCFLEASNHRTKQ